ncbi:MAG: hydrogenase-4 component F [Bacteroidia bacterium]|jgi:hydrogenase-4 component F
MLLYYFIGSFILAAIVYFISNVSLKHGLSILHAISTAFLTFYEFQNLGTKQYEFFQPDYLSIIFLSILSIVNLMAAFHYISYSKSGQVPTKYIGLHNSGIILFTTFIVGVLITNHFGVLWAFVEGTTLCAAILIQHDRNKESMEATWKYVFVCSIAIALAFAGIMFLGFAIQDHGNFDLSFTNIKEMATQLDSGWLKACFLFVLTGFSVKMGLVPLFNVDIDAKDTSPSPVGALLSSVLMNSGFVAIFRFYSAFSDTEIQPWMNTVLIISGIISLFFAAVYIIRINNIKRILAYSSMEHAALVLLAFSSGGIGYFAAILHLCLHSLIKSCLFFQVGQMHNIYGSKQDKDIHGYLKVNPIGALVLFAGLFSAMGFPPSGMFISEYMIFQSIFDTGNWWLLALAFIFILVIIYGLISKILPMIFNSTNGSNLSLSGIRKGESIVQLGIIVMVFYLGLVRPPFVVEFINSATSELLK